MASTDLSEGKSINSWGIVTFPITFLYPVSTGRPATQPMGGLFFGLWMPYLPNTGIVRFFYSQTDWLTSMPFTKTKGRALAPFVQSAENVALVILGDCDHFPFVLVPVVLFVPVVINFPPYFLRSLICDYCDEHNLYIRLAVDSLVVSVFCGESRAVICHVAKYMHT